MDSRAESSSVRIIVKPCLQLLSRIRILWESIESREGDVWTATASNAYNIVQRELTLLNPEIRSSDTALAEPPKNP